MASDSNLTPGKSKLHSGKSTMIYNSAFHYTNYNQPNIYRVHTWLSLVNLFFCSLTLSEVSICLSCYRIPTSLLSFLKVGSTFTKLIHSLKLACIKMPIRRECIALFFLSFSRNFALVFHHGTQISSDFKTYLFSLTI